MYFARQAKEEDGPTVRAAGKTHHNESPTFGATKPELAAQYSPDIDGWDSTPRWDAAASAARTKGVTARGCNGCR